MNSQPQTGRRPMELALTFLQIALLSFGGGLSAHAFNILVEKKCWLGREEFLSFLAISRLLPGANMVNLAVCIGNRCGGGGGAIAAVAGLLLVPLLLVLLLGLLYFHYQYLPGVQSVLHGMAAVAVGLTLSMGFKTLEEYRTGIWPLLLIGLVFLSTAILRWSMFWVLLLLLPAALGWSYFSLRRSDGHD